MKYRTTSSVENCIVLVFLCSLVLVGCSKTESAGAQTRSKPAAVKTVDTEAVKQETVHRAVDVVGTLAALDEVTISSEVDGPVSKILADLGDPVKAGQVMVELDREKLQYNLDQQKATFASALAKYGGTDIDRLPAIEQTPDVQKAKAELVQAQQGLSRIEGLHKRGLVPQQQLDDADAMMRTKQASYDSALLNAKNLRAFIDVSDASMKFADRQVRDTYIRAPFDGYVSKRLVSIGQLVKAQTPVMVVVRMDPLRLTGEIPEHLAPWIKTGQPVTLSVDAFPDKSFTGNLSRISPSVSTDTRAFGFEALVPNPGAILKPGTFARVHIPTTKIEDVLTLPYSAIQYRYGVNRVFIVNGDHLTERELKIGDRLGDRIEIVNGLKSGEAVALTDVDKLNDGMKVSTSRKVE
jgi:multidrug efflux pump subunit AcrA (membrane-fusion protein)